MNRIFLIHENDEWTAPLRAALDARRLPFEDWFLHQGRLALDEAPPRGIFYNRMSASSHTRDHRFAPEYAACVLEWLERHGRRVLNPGRALQLELSKVAQHAVLSSHGIRVPRTIAAVGHNELLAAAAAFDGPFVTKHNRAGKGLGVHRFDSARELEDFVHGPGMEPSVDGVTLVQEYIAPPRPCIMRLEFVGRQFMYAVEVDTSRGFQLCPADQCETPPPESEATAPPAPRFTIIDGFSHPLIPRFQQLMETEGIDVAAFEFITDADGNTFTYDININTNYNSEAENRAGVSGMARLAEYLARELARLDAAPT